MQQAVLIEDLQVNEHHQLYIHVPPEVGAQSLVIAMPFGQAPVTRLSSDDAFHLAAYSAITEENPEEDAIWEETVRT